ncbi:hypothetical protein MPSEU_000448100 [Mayamaea pseudoterrestris]|nr:hypothetical protein MPSEU_000448100 [Mayamaea pseudoterrestris]
MSCNNTSLSVSDYMKRLDQLASKSLSAPEILAQSAGKRQPLRKVEVNQQQTRTSTAAAKANKELGITKTSQPQQTLASSLSSMLTIRANAETKPDDVRSEEDAPRRDDDDDAPAFRHRTVWADPELNDLWTLKRATPIMDENDHDEFAVMESPTKKSRVQTLVWSNSVDTDASHCLEELCRGL